MMTGLMKRCAEEEGYLGKVQAVLYSEEFRALMDEARRFARPKHVAVQGGADAIGLSALQHKEDFGKNAVLDFIESFEARFVDEVKRQKADEEGDHFGASEIRDRLDPLSTSRQKGKKETKQ